MAVIAEWTFEGSLKFYLIIFLRSFNKEKEQALTGTKPVINEERMLVRGKWTVCQFEWYRDNNSGILLASQAFA